jgi:hypothetical protein
MKSGSLIGRVFKCHPNTYYTVISEPYFKERWYEEVVTIMWYDGEIDELGVSVVGDENDVEL